VSFYSDAVEVVDDALSQYGQLVTLTHKATGIYDPATGTAATTTATEIGRGVVKEYNGLNQIDGTLVLQGDKKLLLSPVGITAPKIDDTVIANGITFVIKNIKSLNPAGTVVMYECQVRGA